ncbi:MAG: hypothetical protein LBB10_01970 [Bifidobacteriaceae bacterium]|jgi:hypothetical protein|nr:hypothetical protein [Bifidobacteriaceae bacterium]
MSYEKNDIVLNRFKIVRRFLKIADFEVYSAYDTLFGSEIFLYSTEKKPIGKSLIEKSKLVNSSIILPIIFEGSTNFENSSNDFIYTTAFVNAKSLRKHFSKKMVQESPLDKSMVNNLVLSLAKECEKVGKIGFYPLGLNLDTVLVDVDLKVYAIAQGLVVNKENFNPLDEYDLQKMSAMCVYDLVQLYNYLSGSKIDSIFQNVAEFINYLEDSSSPKGISIEREDNIVKEDSIVKEDNKEVNSNEVDNLGEDFISNEVDIDESLPEPNPPAVLEPEKIVSQPKRHITISLVFTYLLVGIALASTVVFVLFLTGVLK